ncbi:hypothetical protein M1563_04795 [Patescibacteria group bacterium]|nr:hypothetical protein [Patescibacteria group bacterium]MCL5409480.1 hypothetical protein [Patescibacteria group bacterium]
MGEKDITYVGKIETCLVCGKGKSDAVLIDTDHCYPRMLARYPYQVFGGALTKRHPLVPLISLHDNKFRFCRAHHEEVDKGKHEALTSSRSSGLDIDPHELLLYLQDFYPITTGKYRSVQIAQLIRVNTAYIEVVRGLNGELPQDLKDSYLRSADVAESFISKLKNV